MTAEMNVLDGTQASCYQYHVPTQTQHYIDTVQSETCCRIGIRCLCLQDLDNLLDLSEEVTTRGSRDEERVRELSKNR